MTDNLRPQKLHAIPGTLLRELQSHVAHRRVGEGIALLEANRRLLESLAPGQTNAAPLVGYVAQWIDIGFAEPELLQSLLARFPAAARARLSLRDYLHLRMAEGLLSLLHDNADQALEHFRLALTLEDELTDKELVAIAHFWTARCHRKKGEYDLALKHAAAGRNLALGLGFERMAAVMRVLESWLLFQKGHRREAAAVLEEAARVLHPTDDDITLGNIYSAHGRMVRRRGSYQEALKYFSRAIAHFERRNPRHRNLARTLINIAYAQRLIALQISRQIDAESARRRKAGQAGEVRAGRSRNWQRWEQIRAEAEQNLARAEEIYRHHDHHHGIGSVAENRGLLYLDIGELDSAAQQAASANRIAKEQNDFILMARSSMLQCTIASARLEEEIEGGEALEHAQAARDHAREAVEAARHTQNQRLLARAYIALGTIQCHPLINDLEDAKHCCDAAMSLLRTVDFDDLGEQLQSLKQKLAPRGSVDPLLRSWTQGITGDKTFQEMTEQFAELVIPRVWEKEGRKVSRVAKRLSISPKKVRRILGRAGKLKRRHR